MSTYELKKEVVNENLEAKGGQREKPRRMST
jgi:hypothetical protein